MQLSSATKKNFLKLSMADVNNVLGLSATLTEDALNQIIDIFEKIYGINHEKYQNCYSQFLQHLKDFFEEIVNSCKMKLNTMEKKAEDVYKELITLMEELNMKLDFPFDNTQPISTIIERLDSSINEYKIIKQERMEILNSHLQVEKELCTTLGVSYLPSISGVPKEEQIQELEQHIQSLTEEKFKRKTTYEATKDSIVDLMNKLEYSLQHPLLNEIINSTEENYNLHLDYLKLMKNLEDDLKQDLETAQKDVQYLKDKLSKLWTLIKVDGCVQEDFLNNITGVGKSFQSQLKNELERCEEIKRANIKPVIQSIRCEIGDTWEKLTYTEEQKRTFISYFSDTYCDEVLQLHEIELHKLKTYYEENKHILDLAEKRHRLWKRMQHLDHVALDKNRFKNRGGQLLKEEKERKGLEISVPRTDTQLKSYLTLHQEKTGSGFLWHGEDLLKKIDNDWETRQFHKDKKLCKVKVEEPVVADIGTKNCIPATELDKWIPANGQTKKRCNYMPISDEFIPNTKTCKMMKSPIKSHKQLAISSGNKLAIPITAHLSSESINSYSDFQDQIENFNNLDNKKGVLKEVNCPIRAHSSPTSAPKKCKTPKTPRLNTPRQRKAVLTPRSWR